jgi:hexokinase
MADVPKDLMAQIKALEEHFTVDTAKLKEITEHFIGELDKGLQHP